MIHTVSANHKSFRTVTFKEGLNIVLAERAEGSTDKDTRNGVGKTTLIEIIDFCLGSRADKGKGVMITALENWAFTVEITLAGNRVKVTRAVGEKNRIIVDGSTKGWCEHPDYDDERGEYVFNAVRWRTVLGWALFGLPRTIDTLKYTPTFRSLFSYFVRRSNDAYSEPFRHFRQQKPWDIQTNIAYLIGLNWEYASKWQDLKDKEEGAKAIERAMKMGAFDGAFGTIGELETRSVRLEQQVRDTREALDSFRVHPQYEELQSNADNLTAKIHTLTNENIVDRQRLRRYRESIEEEKPPNPLSVEKLYEQAGVSLADTVKKTLEQARTFHQGVVQNRRSFLETEIKRIEVRIRERDHEIHSVTEERANVMQVLEEFGALQEMNLLREQHVALQEELEQTKTRLKELKSINSTKREVKTEKARLVEVAEQDKEDRREIWTEAVKLFNENSQALYRSPGDLVIDIVEKGYDFNVNIDRSGSEGIEKMKIFCFDLAILKIQLNAERGIDFLIHDTLMYDAVDGRQKAKALEHAHKVTSQLGGQYICTMNSDMVPKEDFSKEFNFKEHVQVTLTDDTPAGRLLGIEFERKSR